MAAPTTALILGRRALNRRCGKECVDWAERQLLVGIDTTLMRQLAGMEPPYNHFELAALLDRVLNGLAMPDLSRSDGLRVLAAEVLRPALGPGSDITAAVSDVRTLCIEEGNPAELMDFYFLAFANDDLRENGEQHYWSGATSANILTMMRERAASLVGQVDETLMQFATTPPAG